MIVLSLDPGVTTGWAVLGHDGKVLDTGNLRPEDLREGLTGIVLSRIRQGHEILCVIEKFPLAASGQLATTLAEVVSTIDQVLHRFRLQGVRVTPGVWKTSAIPPSPLAFKDERTTPHQRDAIRMGRYFLGKRSLWSKHL